MEERMKELLGLKLFDTIAGERNDQRLSNEQRGEDRAQHPSTVAVRSLTRRFYRRAMPIVNVIWPRSNVRRYFT